MPPILEMRGIVKEFPGVKALKGVSFEVQRGEIHALCGENGAGKSTLMKILSGVHPHGSYGGAILFEGREMRFGDISDSEAQGIAIIAQELALVPDMSAAENMFLGREIKRNGVIRWRETFEEARAGFQRLGIAIDPAMAVKHLGVGQMQMVEIAKALSKKSTVLILDEPTAALTERESGHLLKILKELKSQGLTCIVISHKLKELLATADRITVLRDGATVGTVEAKAADESLLVKMMVGRSLDDLFHRRPHKLGEEVLRVEGFSAWDARNPEKRLVKEAGLSVRKGEIVGLAGLVGAGRTEFVSALFGAHEGQSEGKVFVDNKPVFFHRPSEAIAAGMALLTEDRKRYGLFLKEGTVFNATLVCLERFSQRGVIDRGAELREAGRLKEELGIKTPNLTQPVELLSGGNQQKVVIARWLLTNPKILVLDEPTRGIDIGAKAEIYELLQALAGRGAGILMVSSELPELLGICDRIYVMHQGEIAGMLPRDQATQEKIMALAAGLHREAA